MERERERGRRGEREVGRIEEKEKRVLREGEEKLEVKPLQFPLSHSNT